MAILFTVAKYLVGLSAAVAVLSAGGLYYYQRSLIYPASFPEGSRTDVATPVKIEAPFEDVELTTPDGVKVKIYLMLAERGPQIRPTVIMYHANAGNMGHRLPLAQVFWKGMKCNVVMLSYRGYGLSEGTPSEKGLVIDAVAALDYVVKHPILSKTKVILYGQSIGGAVCLEVGARRPDVPKAIIIENTFYSLSTLIPRLIPPLRFFLQIPGLLTDRWDSHLAMAKIPASTPVLMLAGAKDQLVHPDEMVALKKVREQHGGKLVWKVYPEGDHNNTCQNQKYWEDVTAFVKSVV